MDEISVVIDPGLTVAVQIRDDPADIVNVTVQDQASQFVVLSVGERGDPGRPPTADEIATAVDEYLIEHPATVTPIEQTYATAVDKWVCNHNLGYTPSVQTMALDRSEIIGNLTYNDHATTIVEFYVPVAGILALS